MDRPPVNEIVVNKKHLEELVMVHVVPLYHITKAKLVEQAELE